MIQKSFLFKAFTALTLMVSPYAFGQDPINQDRPVAAPVPEDNPGASPNWRPSLVNDGIIDRVPHVNKVLPWAPIREIDVAWYQRVWREIPINEKMNQAFLFQGDEYTKGGAFIEILNDAVKKGEVTAYSPLDDQFTRALNLEDFEAQIGGGLDTVGVTDVNTGEVTMTIIKKEFNINSVTRYLVKEDWVFDRNLGRPVVRIIGIAPMIDKTNPSTGEYMYSSPMYWLYYPQAREVIGKYEVYNPLNLVKRMSWSQYLEGGYFSSFVTKYSKNNPTGRDFEKNSLRGLQEGQDVMTDLLNMESDMWEQ